MTDSRTFTSAANHKFRLLGIYINAQTLRPASGCFKIERLQFVNRSKSQPRLLLSSALISAIDMNHNLEIMIIEMVCCERAANEQVGNLIIVVQSHWSDQTLFLEATIDFLVIRHESFITSCSIIVCFEFSQLYRSPAGHPNRFEKELLMEILKSIFMIYSMNS